MGNLTEIDRLIEEGLALYGQGDLDGALLSWEKALEIDPGNSQASSYVEYVRDNYELLTTDTVGEYDERIDPFGIADDEPEYQIEILPGEELIPAEPVIESVDHGWFIEDELPRRSTRTRSADIPQVTLELEADEPPIDESAQPPVAHRDVGPVHATTAEAVAIDIPPISFDDETREYPGGPPKKQDPPVRRASSELPTFADTPDPVTTEFRPEGTPGFGSESTPGFGSPADYQTPPGGFTQLTPGFESTTDVRRRDTGFVQPASATAPQPVERMDERMDDPDLSLGPAGPRSKPELRVTLRSPGDIEIGPAGMEPPVERDPNAEYEEPTGEHRRHPVAVELLASLPSPTPKASTRDLPPATRMPAPATAELKASTSTRDFPAQKTEKIPPTARFDLAERPAEVPTRDLPTSKIPTLAREILNAPTRDLGIRPLANLPPPPHEDEPTTLRKPRVEDGTKSDVILPFDPIDARSAQILDDVDVGAPAREGKEDRTRRRITKLFERAMEWSTAGELDRAVAAIDLALSEDPNSALAQKLIHRNRDTMMTVFQAFLGDLQRQPTLARPLHELASAPISPRAAFLLSRVDGLLSLDEILDVSGMPRLEAYRHLCQLFLRGILR